MKKIVVGLLVVSMLLSVLLSVLVPILSYSQGSHLSSARTLERLGILSGYTNGSLGVNDYLKRQDMVVLLSRLYDEFDIAGNSLASHSFRDITNRFYNPYIGWAVSKGLISGRSSTLFGFNENVTIQEFQTVLLRVLGYTEEAKLWNTNPTLAARLGLMRGVSNRPKSNITRGEMSQMVLNALRTNQKGRTLTLGYVLNLNIN